MIDVFDRLKDSIEIITIESNLSIRFENKKQHFGTKTRDEIDDYWRTLRGCFNGMLIHVKKFTRDDRKITFSTEIGYYKDFVGTKNKRPVSLALVSDIAEYCMPLSVGAIVITKDNKIVVAKRKGTNLNNDLYSFPAEGYFNPKHAINNDISVFNGIADEVKEELGISINELSSFHILGIVYDRLITKQPYIVTIWKTNLSSIEVTNRFNKTKKEEFKSIKFIENEKIPFLMFINEHELTLHNLGKAMLYASYMRWQF